MIVVITDGAEGDFEDIGDYIAQSNPYRAETFVRELLDRCKRLSSFPLRFPLVANHEETGIRRVPHGSYMIYYRVEPTQIEVLRILAAARDHEPILFPDDDADGDNVTG